MDRQAPDTVVLPVGHGTLFLGTYIGFRELREAGLVRRVPRLVGIQSASCAPVYRVFKKGEGEGVVIKKRETLAEGIAIAKPIRWRQILEAVKDTGGEMLSVTEGEIAAALVEMGRKGHYIEPTSAATVAGLKKYLKHIQKEVVLSSLTGTGLKASVKIGHLSIHSKR